MDVLGIIGIIIDGGDGSEVVEWLKEDWLGMDMGKWEGRENGLDRFLFWGLV